jgi:hypothetical protein
LEELTGIWTGNDNGTYYIRQIGNIIWWFARDSNGDKEEDAYFSNVFKGTKTSNIIEGDWSDHFLLELISKTLNLHMRV